MEDVRWMDIYENCYISACSKFNCFCLCLSFSRFCLQKTVRKDFFTAEQTCHSLGVNCTSCILSMNLLYCVISEQQKNKTIEQHKHMQNRVELKCSELVNYSLLIFLEAIIIKKKSQKTCTCPDHRFPIIYMPHQSNKL